MNEGQFTASEWKDFTQTLENDTPLRMRQFVGKSHSCHSQNDDLNSSFQLPLF